MINSIGVDTGNLAPDKIIGYDRIEAGMKNLVPDGIINYDYLKEGMKNIASSNQIF